MSHSCVGIRLQHAAKLLQMLRGMFAFAIRRVGEPHGRRSVVAWPDGHRERRSTSAGLRLSIPGREPTPAPACRRRATCRPSSRSDAALPPTAPATGCFRLPSRPRSSALAPRLDERRSRFADRRLMIAVLPRPTHAPAIPVRLDRAQSAHSALLAAQCNRTWCSSASSAHAGSPRNWRARTPALPKHLPLTSATRPGIADMRPLSARAGASAADDNRTEHGAWVSPLAVEEAGTEAGSGGVDSFSLRLDSGFSSRNSNCSICRCSFSDFRPDCMRCSLAKAASYARSRAPGESNRSSLVMSSWCCARISALSTSAGKDVQIGKCVHRHARSIA